MQLKKGYFYHTKIKGSSKFQLKMLHFFINTGIKDTAYYWNELTKCINVYCDLKKVCPELDSIDIGGGFPIKTSLAFNYDYEYMAAELYDFNEVINAVLDAAIKDGNTLVVVTADHETGGLSLLENKEDKSSFKPNYSSKGHSGVMVPVFAFGPGAEEFGGIYENTAIHYKFLKLLGLNGK
jgi:membrane-anchored protein YejM (alkaline phosphatase superfamily)